jgi:hypothetical protein
VGLVDHQQRGLQRRDQLVAPLLRDGRVQLRRLAVAGRHHREGVAAGEDGLGRLQLAAVELLDPELLLAGFAIAAASVIASPYPAARAATPSRARPVPGHRSAPAPAL